MVIMKTKIDLIKNMIKRLAEDEQDPPVRQFFSVLSSISNETYFKNILIKILEKRLMVTEEHLAYLIYISFQYLTNFAYDKKHEKEKLEKDLVNYSDRVINFCQTKYASTNVVERYGLLQIILAIIKKPCVVIDLGASIGIGLMSLNTNSFSNIKTNGELRVYLKKKIKISKAIGVDIQQPDLRWQLACYLPENKKDRIRLEKQYNKLKEEGTKITLIQGDIIELGKINLPRADVIWTSNTLYQIEGDVNKLIRDIQALLKENGIWINADYRYENKKFATPENPYVAMVRRKEEWNKTSEVLTAQSDVVGGIKPGKDFEKFKSVCEEIATIR